MFGIFTSVAVQAHHKVFRRFLYMDDWLVLAERSIIFSQRSPWRIGPHSRTIYTVFMDVDKHVSRVFLIKAHSSSDFLIR